MGCLLTVIALMVPRVLMAFIFLLTDWFGRAYDGALLPLLGFVFLPYTTLAYMAAIVRNGSLGLFWTVVVILAVLVDLGHWGEGRRRTHRRRRRGPSRRIA